MDDEKSITEKLTDAISKAADSVKSVASTLVDKASNAAQHAMEANAEKIARIPPAKTVPTQVAGTSNEQVTIPETNDAAAMPMPLIPAAPARTKKRASNKAAAVKVKKKKLANEPATKSANKAAKKTAVKKTNKAANKSSVRSSKTAKRKSKKQEF
jgi:hypothetical protein